MNITDIEKLIEAGEIEAPPEGDMLELMFERQNQLIDKYHGIEKDRGAHVIDREMFGLIDHRYVQFRLKDLSQRVIEELMECTNTLRNKPWSQTDKETDVDHMKEELADTFHFLLEFAITAGISAKELFYLYYLKSETNKFRIRTKY